MLGLILFLIMGLVAGLLARAIMPGRDPLGWIGTMVLGVVGAFIGGFLFGGPDNAVGYLGAIVGALIVLFLYRLVVGRGRTGDAF